MHFSLAVISEINDPLHIENLLVPYHAGNEFSLPREYLEFEDRTEEVADQYENGHNDWVMTDKGELLYIHSHQFKEGVPEAYNIVTLRHYDRYPTLEDFGTEYCHYNIHPDTGRIGVFCNPQGIWDWYVIGGRWAEMLILKSSGSRVNSARICDVDWDAMAAEEAESARQIYRNAHTPDANMEPSYFGIRPGETEDQFAQRRSLFHTYAILMGDTWIDNEDGKLTGDEWNTHFKALFIDTVDPKLYITIVDCHM